MIKVNPEHIQAFSAKHGVYPVVEKCRNCGKEVHVNVPVITKDFVGFESVPHKECGEGFKISVLKERE